MHEQTIALRTALSPAALAALPPKAAEVLRADFTAPDDVKALNDGFKARHAASSPLHALAAARVDRALGVDLAQCEKALVGVADMPAATLEDATAVLDTLRSWHAKDGVAAFKAAAAKRWPEASAFAAA